MMINLTIRKAFFFVLTLLSLPVFVFGQIDSLRIELKEVIIKSNRIELPFSENSRTIHIITKAQIQALPVQSINEVLQYIAGIDVRRRGVNGAQADISIRGGTFDQILVLINGVKMSDPQTGHHVMNLPIDLENIERIEIIKGPAARIFGQNAFTGAINVITKIPNERYIKAQLDVGDWGLNNQKLNFSLPQNKLRHFISISRDANNGYRYNTDFQHLNAFYQNSIQLNNQQLGVTAGFSDRRFGANGFYASPTAKDQYEATQTSMISLDYQKNSKIWTSTSRCYWRRNQDEYIYIRNNPSVYRNMHISQVIGLEWNSTLESKFGKTGLGVEIGYQSIQSNNLGKRQRQVIHSFIEHRFHWKRLDFTPGFSYNYYADFGANFLPGLDIGFGLTQNSKIYANIGKTYRIPTYTDLYYNDKNNEGNVDLKPEAALGYEIGYKYNRSGISFSANLFRRDGRDLIDWTKAKETDKWQPKNFSNSTFQGFEANLELLLPLFNNLKIGLQRFSLSYTYINAEILANDFQFSRYALDNLKHQMVLGAEQKIYSKLFLSAQYRYCDRLNLLDYQIFDAKIMWKAKSINAYIEASNIFNENYTETNLVPMPLRWFKGGISYKF